MNCILNIFNENIHVKLHVSAKFCYPQIVYILRVEAIKMFVFVKVIN